MVVIRFHLEKTYFFQFELNFADHCIEELKDETPGYRFISLPVL